MKLNTNKLLSDAKKSTKKGEIEKARQIYLSILKVFPKNLQAKIGLKDLEEQSNNVKKNNLTKSQLDSVISLIQSGEIKRAIESLNTLIQGYPNAPILFNLMGICLNSILQFDKAAEAFFEATKLKPDYAEAFYNLGSSQKKLGKFQDAIVSFKKAIEINSNYPDAHNNLGNIYKDLGHINEAINSYEWAIGYRPEYVIAYINLAILYSSFELDKALHFLNKAIAINPNIPEAHHSLGTVLSSLGRIDESIKSYQKALEIRPDYADAHNALSTIKKYTKDDPQIKEIKSLLKKSKLTLSNRISLNFSLANVNENLNKPKEFIKYLNEANRLNKEMTNYTINKDKEIFLKIRDIFQKSNFKTPKLSSNNINPRPIFIIGMPRSGTSLVEQILSSHSEVYGAGELDFLSKGVIYEIQKIITGNDDFDVLSKNSILELNSNEFDKINSTDFFNKIFTRYHSLLSLFNISENIFTDKMPLNFRFVGFILSAFPEAKIIHLKRDPIATCWSIYKHHFKSNGNSYSSSLNDLASYYQMYKQLMSFWHEKYPDKIYDICYENLTVNQEKETRNLLKYCALKWDKNCLSFYENSRAVHTASGLQVREKMYTGSSDAWRDYEAHLKPLISKLT